MGRAVNDAAESPGDVDRGKDWNQAWGAEDSAKPNSHKVIKPVSHVVEVESEAAGVSAALDATADVIAINSAEKLMIEVVWLVIMIVYALVLTW